MLLNGVLMSEPVARWRVVVSAATNPPGVSVMPLNLIEAGPSSEFCGLPLPPAFVVAATVFTVEVSAALLALRSVTLEVSVASLDFTSADVFTASTAFDDGFHRARIRRSRCFARFVDLLVALAQLFFQQLELFLLRLHGLLQFFEFSCDFRIRLRGFLGCGLGLGRLRRFRRRCVGVFWRIGERHSGCQKHR